jgi:integrase
MSEKRVRGAGRIFMRGTTAWVQYYVHGRQVRESTHLHVLCQADMKKVERFLHKRLGEVEAGIRRDTRHVTYESLRESLYNDYQINARKSLRRSAEGKPLLPAVKRLDEFFAGYRAEEIDADLIRKFVTGEQGRGRSNGTVNRSVSALRRMFNLARREGKLRDIPFFPMAKEASPRQGFFEHEQYEALLKALPEYLRLPTAIGYYSGMRLGEILALEWSQVDFLRGVIRLRAGETKNDDAREIPIVPQLRTLLVEQRTKREPDCPYVCFRFDRRGRAVKIQGFRKAWYSSCIRSGLGKMEPKTDRVTGELLYAPPRGPHSKPKVKMIYDGLIFHDLRRTGARALVHAGVPEKVAMAIGGWKTRSVFDRYNIVSANDLAEAGRKLGIFHGKNVGDKTGTISTLETPPTQLNN